MYSPNRCNRLHLMQWIAPFLDFFAAGCILVAVGGTWFCGVGAVGCTLFAGDRRAYKVTKSRAEPR